MNHLSRESSPYSRDVREMMNRPDFKEDLARVNTILAANLNEEQMSSDDSETEQKAVTEFNEKYFGVEWLERDTRFVLAYEDDDTYLLGVETRTGKFVSASPLLSEPSLDILDRENARVVPGIARRALWFVYLDQQNMEAVSINPELILEMTVDVPEPITDDMAPREILTRYNEQFTHLLQTQTFLSADLETQQAQVNDFVDIVGQHFRVFQANDTMHEFVIVNNEAQNDPPTSIHTRIASLALPGMEKRDTPYRSPDEYEVNGELCAELIEEDGTIHTIPLSRIADIKQSFHSEIPDSFSAGMFEAAHSNKDFDYLKHLTDSDLSQLIADTENDLSYNNYETDELIEEITAHVHEIKAQLGSDFGRFLFWLDGLVYEENDDDCDILEDPKWRTYDTAIADDVYIKRINGKWRVVIAFSVPNASLDSADEETEVDMDTIYAVPDADHLSQLLAYEPSTEITAHDSQHEVHQLIFNATRACESLVQSSAFNDLSLDDQVAALNGLTQSAKEAVESLSPEPLESGRVTCLATRYWAVNWNAGHMPAREIAKDPSFVGDDNNPAILHGEEVLLGIPEIIDRPTDPFHGVASFPLSNGKPMIILYDRENMITYYVPATDAQLFSPADHSTADESD